MATVKKLPERLCLGCQERFLKKDLVRIVKSPEGEFSVDTTGKLDLTGKLNGRGAYICKKVDCLRKAVKGHRFERSFKGAIDKSVYEVLEQQLQDEGSNA